MKREKSALTGQSGNQVLKKERGGITSFSSIKRAPINVKSERLNRL